MVERLVRMNSYREEGAGEGVSSVCGKVRVRVASQPGSLMVIVTHTR